MIDPHEVQRLLWEGDETIEDASHSLRQGRAVRLELPSSYHHSLFAHLHPHCPPGSQEQVEQQGGPELLARIARIQGLEGLRKLEEVVQKATVRVESPAPVVLIRPSELA